MHVIYIIYKINQILFLVVFNNCTNNCNIYIYYIFWHWNYSDTKKENLHFNLTSTLSTWLIFCTCFFLYLQCFNWMMHSWPVRAFRLHSTLSTPVWWRDLWMDRSRQENKYLWFSMLYLKPQNACESPFFCVPFLLFVGNASGESKQDWLWGLQK